MKVLQYPATIHFTDSVLSIGFPTQTRVLFSDKKSKSDQWGGPIMVHESDPILMKILIIISLQEEIERGYRTRFHYRNDRTTQRRAIICDLQIRFSRELREVTEERGYSITAIDVGNSLTAQQIQDYNNKYLKNPDVLFHHLHEAQMSGFKTIP